MSVATIEGNKLIAQLPSGQQITLAVAKKQFDGYQWISHIPGRRGGRKSQATIMEALLAAATAFGYRIVEQE